jgi:hypothetical protein
VLPSHGWPLLEIYVRCLAMVGAADKVLGTVVHGIAHCPRWTGRTIRRLINESHTVATFNLKLGGSAH